MTSQHPPRRKGAARMADIPPDVLRALNEGREETITLVEWLAIDMAKLLGRVAENVGLKDESDALVGTAKRLADEGVTRRTKGIGAALFHAIRPRPDRADIFEALASYSSDMVRAWAAYMIMADESIDLAERLQATRRFAADSSMSVRETAWDSFRPYIIEELERALLLLEPWVRDPDPNIRRCAVEGTRPRGVWTAHIERLKQSPELAVRLLEPVRSDPSRYVQRAVANWINDASKSRPDWVLELTARWERESPSQETLWIINHALRTLRKQRSARSAGAARRAVGK